MVSSPMLAPRLIPETTTSGNSPSRPVTARGTQSVGVPAIITTRRHRPGHAALQPAQPVDQRLQQLDAGERLVLGFHDRPGRDVGGGAVDHIAHRGLVLGPLLAVAPVFLGELEALARGLLALLAAAQL